MVHLAPGGGLCAAVPISPGENPNRQANAIAPVNGLHEDLAQVLATVSLGTVACRSGEHASLGHALTHQRKGIREGL